MLSRYTLPVDIVLFILLAQMETALSHMDPTVATLQYNGNLSAGGHPMSILEANILDLHTPRTVPLISPVVQVGVIGPIPKDGPQTEMSSMDHISFCLARLRKILLSRTEIFPICQPT